MLMYKNIICFFYFPFITQNVRMDRVKEGRRWLTCSHTGRMVWLFSESSVFLLRSTFTRLVQGHIKASNHLTFSPLLCFRVSGIISNYQIVLVSSRFSTFASLVQLRHLSSLNRTVWDKASAQSGVTSRSSPVGLSRSPWVSIFPGLYNFPNAHAIFVVTPPAYALYMDMPSI